MSAFYDEVEWQDMTWDAASRRFSHPCPCGDVFGVALDELLGGEEVARCPSCSLLLRVAVGDFDALEAFGEGEAQALRGRLQAEAEAQRVEVQQAGAQQPQEAAEHRGAQQPQEAEHRQRLQQLAEQQQRQQQQQQQQNGGDGAGAGDGAA